ncbi:GTP pyrophosphokinase [Neisseria sp. ZJ106]|uniref:GTP pyrophosphokinase n=1 Tax=Neisseria lisongii TaxID=2912188 RepID=A0ABY7RLP4_9NEIS|nr:GTP pyrophosphokinase [Neisseria lisongii]MCF7520726.1 GTP pyrophosphokinase [Neisseria lisongii]WCL72372.1 GTP pyrophosphokinase [Neisseria lisongii]
METNVEKTERLIREINLIHAQYSQDYFETGKVEKINLSHTLHKVSVAHILSYRLNLHEAVNDYLAFADIRGIDFFYRVKTGESIEDKIRRYLARENQYPVNNILNDIFGARVILPSPDIAEILNRLDGWKTQYGLKNWYLRDVCGYIGIHVYFKNASNFYYPWELQIWDEKDAAENIRNHIAYKRNFVQQYAVQQQTK